jgi:hypothetical protein
MIGLRKPVELATVLLAAVLLWPAAMFLAPRVGELDFRWGQAPFDQEYAEYLAEKAPLKHRIAFLDDALAELTAQRYRLWSRWTEAERRRALAWFADSDYEDAELRRRRDHLRREFELAWQRWHYQKVATRAVDLGAESPTSRAARRHLWSYSIDRLREQARYLQAELRYRERELRGLRAYRQHRGDVPSPGS